MKPSQHRVVHIVGHHSADQIQGEGRTVVLIYGTPKDSP